MSPADGFVASAPARIQRAGGTQRRFIRLRSPITVDIEGTDYRVRDWSADGFCLEGIILPPACGTPLDALLRFNMGAYTLEAGVEAVVLRADAQQGTLAAQFTELAPRTQNLLHSMVDAALTGEIVSPAQLLNLPPAPAVAARAARARDPSWSDRLVRGGFLAAVWGLALSLFAIILVGSLDRLFIVKGTGIVRETGASTAIIHAAIAETDVGRLRTGNMVDFHTLLSRRPGKGTVIGLTPDNTHVLIRSEPGAVGLQGGERVSVRINTLDGSRLP